MINNKQIKYKNIAFYSYYSLVLLKFNEYDSKIDLLFVNLCEL